MATEMQVKGMKALQDKLKKLPDKLAKNIARSAVRAMGMQLRDAAREKAPVDTGRLRKSITRRDSRGKSKFEFVDKVSAGVGYANLVENGTSQMPAQPFMRPAFDEEKDSMVDTFTQKLQQRIEKEMGK